MHNPKAKSFKDLQVWQEGHKLVIAIYKVTKEFPRDEIFGLTSQIRRASVSITSNLSEGFNRISTKEKLQFYYIALGSLSETQNQLLIAKDVGYIKPKVFDKIEIQTTIIQRLLNALLRKIKSSAE